MAIITTLIGTAQSGGSSPPPPPPPGPSFLDTFDVSGPIVDHLANTGQSYDPDSVGWGQPIGTITGQINSGKLLSTDNTYPTPDQAFPDSGTFKIIAAFVQASTEPPAVQGQLNSLLGISGDSGSANLWWFNFAIDPYTSGPTITVTSYVEAYVGWNLTCSDTASNATTITLGQEFVLHLIYTPTTLDIYVNGVLIQSAVSSQPVSPGVSTQVSINNRGSINPHYISSIEFINSTTPPVPSPAPPTPPQPAAPVANFTASPLSGSDPLTVSFTDTSTGEIIMRTWYFSGNGVTWIPFGEGASNPTRRFTSGTYSIRLVVVNTGGDSTETRTDYITVT